MSENNKPSFLRNRADTLAIIAVNIVIGVIYVCLLISEIYHLAELNSKIAQQNDKFYELLKERR